MSEYQYYEFAAVDGPISDDGLRYARGCSSRAEVSRLRWRNTYTFGDFHGSVDTLLRHYDVHFYIANWGAVRLGLAFPKSAIALDVIKPYFRKGKRYDNTLTVKETGDRRVIWWEREEDGDGGWTEGEGLIDDLIDDLIGIREELLHGDYRALFLGWLADFYLDDWENPEDSGAVIPPIPPGLDCLSPAQTALMKHFSVDCDALSVASGLSEGGTPARIPIAAVLEKLSESEMRAMLARVAEGGGAPVMTELNRLTYPPMQSPVAPTMRCMDFAAKAIEARDIRKKKEAEAAAATRLREAEARVRHLASVMDRADAAWLEIDRLMEQKKASAYEQAAGHLQELRDAYAQAEKTGVFHQKLNEFRRQYSNRSAMLRRIEKL